MAAHMGNKHARRARMGMADEARVLVAAATRTVPCAGEFTAAGAARQGKSALPGNPGLNTRM